MLKFMLDTSICIYVIKRKPIEILHTFNQHAGKLCVSSITLAELMHGVEKSQHKEHNFKKVEDFISRLDVIDFDDKAAFHYAEVRSSLEKQGNIIGVNDLHIAGHARSQSLILITNNEKEFNRVEGLRVQNWIS